MNQPTSTDNQNIKPTVTKKKSIGKIIGIIIGSIIAVIATLVIIIFVSTDAPIKVSDEFLNDIQTGKSTAAYNLMSDEAKNATDSATFDAVVKRIAPILTGKPNLISREISAKTGVPTTATVVYEIQGTDAKYNMTITLQENNGKWQVLKLDNKAQR